MADITGTNQNDVIVGTADADTINGGNGNDTIDGGAGDDTIDGGNGNDIIDGGNGNDTIDAGKGNDLIIEEINVNRDGVDFIDGENGFDTLRIILTQQQFEKLQVAIDAFNELTDVQKKTTEFSFGDILEANDFDRRLFDVTVINVQALDIQLIANTGPTADNDENTIFAEGVGTVSGNVLENDTDPDFLDDLDVISITGFGETDNTPGNGLMVTGQFGTLNVDPETGAYIYDLDNNNAQVIALPDGETLQDQFTYTITDEAGETSTATLTITIVGVNNPPDAMDDSLVFNEITFVPGDSSPMVANLLNNDSDPDGDALTIIYINFVEPTSNLFDVSTSGVGTTTLIFTLTLPQGIQDLIPEAATYFNDLKEGAAIVMADSNGDVDVNDTMGFTGFLGLLPSSQVLVFELDYIISDGFLTDTAHATITVNGVDNRDLVVADDMPGSQILSGGANGDLLISRDDGDTLNGGDGNDYLVGNEGSDTLNGGVGEDTLVGGDLFTGTKILNGGTGIDTLIGGDNHSGTYILNGDTENDTLTGGSNSVGGAYTLNGGKGNDTLTAGSNNINNSADKYNLLGGDGDDNLETGDGNHVLDGGTDNDTAIYHSDVLQDGVRTFINAMAPTPEEQKAAADAIVAAMGNLNYSFDLDSVGSFSGILVNDLVGDDGNDLIVATLGTTDSSTIETINFRDDIVNHNYNLVNGVQNPGGSTSINISNGTTIGDDLVVGGDNIAVVYIIEGDDGKDVLVGGTNSGSYAVRGGTDNDVLIGGSNSGTEYRLTGNTGNDVLIGGLNAGSLYNLSGGEGNDILIGGENTSGTYTLFGDLGNDILETGIGDHVLDGGADSDTAIYHSDVLQGDVRTFINAMAPTLEEQKAAADAIVAAMGNLNYSFDLGSVGSFSGILVNDLVGDDGNDLIVAMLATTDSSTIETINFADVEGGQYRLINGLTPIPGGSQITVGGIDDAAVDNADLIVGGSGAPDTHTLAGGLGNDILIGGIHTGTDYILNGDSGNDVLVGGQNFIEGGAVGSVYTLNGGTDNDVLIGGANKTFYFLNGGDGDDVLIGGENNELGAEYNIFGEAGNDILETGEGDHLLDGGEEVGDNDTAIYHSDVLALDVRTFVEATTPTQMQVNAVVAAASMLLNYDFSLFDGSVFDGIQIADQVGTDGTDVIVADVTTSSDEFTSSIETINFDGKDYVLANGVFSNSAGSFEQISFDTFSNSTLLVGGENTGNGSRYELVGGTNHDIVVGGENTGTGDFIGYTLVGNEGNDILVGGENSASKEDMDDENTYDLFGGSGNDILLGGSNTSDGIYNLFGEGGNDVLIAGSNTGAASLYVLSGGDGEDVLVDSSDNITLTGGNDKDTFVFIDTQTGFGDDIVTDFMTNNDNTLDLGEDILKFISPVLTQLNFLDRSEVVNDGTDHVKLLIDPDNSPNNGDESSIVFSNIDFIAGIAGDDLDDYIPGIQVIFETP